MNSLTEIPILSIVTYIPLVGALAIVFLIPKEKTATIRAFATLVAVVDFVVSLPLWWVFDRGKDGFYTMNDSWFGEYVFEIAARKSALPARLRRALDTEPIVLPAWDPMGALAR